jgi:hypothetical protein
MAVQVPMDGEWPDAVRTADGWADGRLPATDSLGRPMIWSLQKQPSGLATRRSWMAVYHAYCKPSIGTLGVTVGWLVL